MGGSWQVATLLISSINFLLLLFLLFRKPIEDSTKVELYLDSLEKNQEKLERSISVELLQSREESFLSAKEGRKEARESMDRFTDLLLGRMTEIVTLEKNQWETFTNQLANLTQMNETKLEKIRGTVEEKLSALQNDNSKKLEEMRQTVDEKLHATLEKRLGESFQLVSSRLEQVHKGLGEMQTLATGVGDLKRVLTNVKTRGTWGEIQLGNLLEQILSKEQYAENVAVKKGSRERVEFAIKLPGAGDGEGEVWLPIDAKFPQEDYLRLVEAQEEADLAGMEETGRMLEVRIKNEAKTIKEKYLHPPLTTDFAIMFLPTESLYAEVLRRPGLAEEMQRLHRVVVAGPTTLAALLNSLQMGFRTLAIERRSSEVWTLLGAVKTEFNKFGQILEKTQKKLQEASNTIENAARKSRTIERKLRKVEELPAPETEDLLAEEASAE